MGASGLGAVFDHLQLMTLGDLISRVMFTARPNRCTGISAFEAG